MRLKVIMFLKNKNLEDFISEMIAGSFHFSTVLIGLKK